MSLKFDYSFGNSVGYKANIGMIVLQTDKTLEYDLRRMMPAEGVALYISRIPNQETVSTESLSKMQDDLTAFSALLPDDIEYDVIGYGCTSASSVIGNDKIAKLILDAQNARAVITPVTSLIDACNRLKISNLAMLTPYVESVSASLRQTLQLADINTNIFGSFEEDCDPKVALIDGESVYNAAIALAEAGDCDGIFLSCTNLQTLDVISRIEKQCNIPVLSSNLVLGWQLMERASIKSPRPEIASLLSLK